MPLRPSRLPLVAGCLTIVSADWVQATWTPVRWRYALVAAVGLLGSVAWRRRNDPFVWTRQLALAVAATAILAAGQAWFEPTGNLVGNVARHLTPILLGWSVVLAVARHSPDPIDPDRVMVPERLIPVGLVFLTLAITSVATHFSSAWFDSDEVVYAIEAARLMQGEVVQRVEPGLLRFFLLPSSFIVPDGFVPQYPPGWPLLLGAFSSAGLRSLVGPVLAAVTIACTYGIARRLHSVMAGVTAAALLLLHWWFLQQGASLFSHTATMAMLTGAALLLFHDADRSRVGPASVGAGVLVGWAIATRPLTGLLFGVALGAWVTLLRKPSPRLFAMGVLGAVVGAIPGVAGLLAWNAQTTGDPFLLGYQALHGSLHSLGFGLRGIVEYDSLLQPVRIAKAFTPAVAEAHFWTALAQYARHVLPLGLVVPIVALALWSAERIRVAVALPFLVVPGVYFFYFDDLVRLWSELLPFLFIGIGVVLARLYDAGRVRRGTITALVAAQAMVSLLTLSRAYRAERDGFAGNGFAFMEEVARLREERGPILVFVNEPDDQRIWFHSLSLYNVDRFPGDIIVARDLGPANEALIERFPTHEPLLLSRTASGNPVRDVPRSLTLRRQGE